MVEMIINTLFSIFDIILLYLIIRINVGRSKEINRIIEILEKEEKTPLKGRKQ